MESTGQVATFDLSHASVRDAAYKGRGRWTKRKGVEEERGLMV